MSAHEVPCRVGVAGLPTQELTGAAPASPMAARRYSCVQQTSGADLEVLRSAPLTGWSASARSRYR